MRYYAAIMCVTLLEREAGAEGRTGGRAFPCLLAIMLPEAWEHWVGWPESGLGMATKTQRHNDIVVCSVK